MPIYQPNSRTFRSGAAPRDVAEPGRSELGNSQFFITSDDSHPFLNGKFTVVGEVESGMDVVDKIYMVGGNLEFSDRMIRVRVDGYDILRPTTKK